MTFATLMAVSSCNPSTPNWNEKEQNLMKENLYGEVLPYISDCEVSLDENTIIIKGKEVNENDIKSYASNYSSWRDYSSDYTSDYGKYFYTFEKVVTTSEGKRAITVQFSAVDEENYVSPVGSGTFLLTASDPYLHEFPSKTLSDAVSTLFGSDVQVPVFEADYYQLSSGNSGVYCFIDSTTEDAGYSQILTDNNWVIDTVRDSDGFIVANSSDGNYSISYLYNNSYRSLDIYLALRVFNSWPSQLISRSFSQYGLTQYQISTLEKDGYRYNFYDLGDSIRVGIYTVDREDFDLYLGNLEEEDWKISGPDKDGGYCCTKEYSTLKGIASMTIYYDKGDVFIVMNLAMEPIRTNVWPKDDISALFNKYSKYGAYEFDFPTLVVNGALYYVYEYPNNDLAISYGAYSYCYGAVVVSNIKSGDIVTYQSNLTKSGFIKGDTEDGLTIYTKVLSNGDTAKMGIGVTSNDEFVIVFYLFPTPAATTVWPEDKIKALIPYVNDEIPAFTGKASDYAVYNDAYGKTVVISVEKGKEIASQSIYRYTLEQAGWKFVSYDEFCSTYIYLSPNEEVYLETYVANEGTFSFDLREAPSGWNSSRINDMLKKLSFELTDTVPEYVGGPLFLYNSYDGGANNYSYVYVEVVGEEQEINDFITNYTKALGDSSWQLEDDGYYYSPNHQLSAEFATKGSKTYLVFYIEK